METSSIKATSPQKSSSEITTELTLPAMGGHFIYKCYPQNNFSQDEVLNLFKQAHQEVKRVENKLTDFKESPFNKINQYAGISPVQVDNEILFIIKKSIEYSKKSNGVFDISFATIGHRWRDLKNKNKTLSQIERDNLKKLINYKHIQIDEKNSTVFLPHKDMRIGLGGIGKGYAVDCAFDWLKKEGLINFYINGSGDIRVHSHLNAPRQWRVGIRNPFSKDPTQSCGVIQIQNGSLCTSGSYINFNQNKKDHHVINPHTGKSQNEVISASVLTDSTLESDVTGTILLNMKVKDALDYSNHHNLFTVLIDKKGTVHLSKIALKRFGA